MNHSLNTDKLKLNILKSITLILISLIVLVVSIVLYTQNKNLNFFNQIFHNNIHKSIEHTFEHNTNHYKFLLRRIVQTSHIKNYLENNNKDVSWLRIRSFFYSI